MPLKEITKAFSQVGFEYKYDKTGLTKYFGKISSSKYGDVFIIFEFDKELLSYPRARISEESRHLFKPFHFPHLNDNWILCYHDNSLVFDPTDAENMVANCLSYVKELLDKTNIDDMKEITREFKSYWKGDIGGVYDDFSEEDNEIFFSNNCISRLEFQVPKKMTLIKVPNLPNLKSVNLPIEKLEDLLLWLKDYPQHIISINNEIKTQLQCKRGKTWFCLHSEREKYYLGICFESKDPIINSKIKRLRGETVDVVLNNPNNKIHRFWITKLNSLEIITANNDTSVGNPQKFLMHKKLLLIGCGTIGSNLAQILLKSGCGLGSGGQFDLIDNDTYEPENFSRHFLGITYSGASKSEALKKELSWSFPFAKINSFPKNVAQKKEILGNYDLIIDTTGEERLTYWLSEVIASKSKKQVLISVWIKNLGNDVEGIIQSSSEGGCHYCAKKLLKSNESLENNLPMRNSCQSVFVPFPITASLYASLLAMKMINTYLDNTELASKYFYQKINSVGEINEIDIVKIEGCPVCGRN